MAIAPISVGDTNARAKMNQAIAKANEVDGKATTGALAVEAAARAKADAAEAMARAEAVASANTACAAAVAAEVAARTGTDTALNERINGRAAYADVVAEFERPGEIARLATAEVAGAPELVAPLDGARAVSSSNGAVIAIRAGYVAPIAVRRVEPGRQYRLRFVVQRVEDTSDPANDAIRFGVAWLKADKSKLSESVIADLVDIVVASGRLEYTYRLSRVDGDAIDVVCPAPAVYVRPFVRCYGNGLNHIEVIEWSDLSSSIDWSPDVSSFRNELAGMNHRLEVAEGQISSLADEAAVRQEAATRSSFALVSTDVDFAISAVSDARLIHHNGVLSQTRQAALIVSGAQTGATVRIARSGGGGFPLNVGPGLKAMGAGTWADFSFDGTEWFLAASGTL